MVAERVAKGQAAPAPTKSESGANDKASSKKGDLAGKTFAEQEAMLAPAENGQQGQQGRSGEGPVTTPASTSAADTTAPTTEPAASTAPPLAADAFVLSREARWATSAFVGWFQQSVAQKCTEWGAGIGDAKISLANDGGADVIAMTWSSSWGPRPVTREIGMQLNPIEAKLAVQGVHSLSGWSTVDGAAQGKLDALLGGETNLVSGAARGSLRPKFAPLKGKPAEEQKATLEGLIGARDAVPYLADEEVKTEPAHMTLSSPTEEANYAFRGGPGDALIYTASFDDGTSIKIIAPKAPDAGMHYHTVQEAAEAASYLPHKSRMTINTVLLNSKVNPDDAHWAVQYNTPDFHSYMTAGAAGVVTIYPNNTPVPNANGMRGSMIHETGHAWSYQQWGQDTTQGKWADWRSAMNADRISVSGYAMNDIAEDVAETVRVFGATKGTPKYDEYKAMVPKRLEILETEMG